MYEFVIESHCLTICLYFDLDDGDVSTVYNEYDLSFVTNISPETMLHCYNDLHVKVI